MGEHGRGNGGYLWNVGGRMRKLDGRIVKLNKKFAKQMLIEQQTCEADGVWLEFLLNSV